MAERSGAPDPQSYDGPPRPSLSNTPAFSTASEGHRTGFLAKLGPFAVLLIASSAFGGDEPPDDAVAAKVDGQPIYARTVDRVLQRAVGQAEVHPAALPILRARLLRELVDRRLVLAYAERTKSGATPEEVDAAWDAMAVTWQRQGRSLEDLLEARSIDEADLRREITWSLTWKKLSGRYITDRRLAAHFESHRREFDGSEVSVRHIRLRPEPHADSDAIDALMKQAALIRIEITSGKLSFEAAARRHSTGPSAEQGGRLGFIRRHGAMAEAFARAAFALEPGQVSRPIRTRFGVHLIRPDEIKPGEKQWTDVRRKLAEALDRELIDKLAQVQRAYSKVEIIAD